MDAEKQKDNPDDLSSKDLAALIVDALMYAGVVSNDDFKRAIEIATEEIEVRKAMGDY